MKRSGMIAVFSGILASIFIFASLPLVSADAGSATGSQNVNTGVKTPHKKGSKKHHHKKGKTGTTAKSTIN